MTKPKVITEILDNAQKIIISKDPKAQAFINKKLKETNAKGNIPVEAR